MAESKYTNRVTKTQKLSVRKELPEAYHCDCDYCTKKFLGEIYDVENDTYYSQLARNKYYVPNRGKHIAPGHWQGYRYAIQRFTKKGDWVFDPTVGTGTAIVEAINNGRNGAGIELEFHELTQANIDHQGETPGKYHFFPGGNARELSPLLNSVGLKEESLSLVINGTPYPTIAGVSSDGYERAFSKDIPDHKDKVRDYQVEENFGAQRLAGKYWPWVIQMYLDCIPHLKKNGKIVIIVKDMVQKKQPWLLHKMIVDRILDQTDELKHFGSFMHKHIPSTMFMNTYPKRFPDVKIPLYQMGIVLRKR
jgi:DNA modification methylase